MTQLQAPTEPGRLCRSSTRTSATARFDDLQLTMPSVWESMQLDFDDESVVVVPSISIERTTPGSGTIMQAMEERALFLLLLLRQPRLRMIYVTSQPVSESIVEYYLGLLPGVIPSHARARLTLVSVGDASPDPLSAKLLARPRLLREIRALIPNPARSHLIPYNTTPLERDVALSLGIPMYGADPRLADLGSKTGCRRMFEELGVRCPVGAEDLHTLDDIVAGVQSMRVRRPSLSQAIVKLNEGVSGSGNALVDLHGLPAPGSPDEAAAITDRVLGMQLEAEKLDRRRLPGRLREERRHRRGADHRSRADQSERPDAGAAGRHRRAAVHPRPASRRRERSEVPRLRVPGRIPTTPRPSPSPRW